MKEQENLTFIEEVMELYKQKKYDELIEKEYISALEVGIRRENEEYFIKDFIILKYLCFSAYETGYYYNCLVLMDKLFSTIPFYEKIYELEEQKYFLEIALESVWYCYINNIKLEKNNNKSILEEILNFSLNFYKINGLEKSLLYNNIEKIYGLTKLGKLPYYKVLFFVPFPLNFEIYL